MTPAPYQVHASAHILAGFQQLLERADRSGRSSEIVSALDRILKSLQKEPLDFGESRDPLAELKLVQRIAVERPLVVQFAVNENQRIVWIKSIRPISGSGL